MKRCLFIIGNQGSAVNNTFLPGVSMDVNSYLSFFKSANGGAWECSEIVPKHFGWTKCALHHEIYCRRMAGLDYAVIVFAGHGYAVRGGIPYFELSENEDVSLVCFKRITWRGRQ